MSLKFKRSIPTGAIFSPCRRYRYVLLRNWDSSRPTLLFIGLNPSTADETVNDPTMRRCLGFANAWGYGGMIVTNVFGYRATKPTDLREAKDPIGPECDRWIATLCDYVMLQDGTAHGKDVILFWGNHGKLLGRDRTILPLIQSIVPHPHCLAITKQNQPSHLLYLRKSLKPIPYIES